MDIKWPYMRFAGAVFALKEHGESTPVVLQLMVDAIASEVLIFPALTALRFELQRQSLTSARIHYHKKLKPGSRDSPFFLIQPLCQRDSEITC